MQKDDRTQTSGLSIRPAEEKDAGLLLTLIKALAEYEHLSAAVTATEETLRDSLFRRKAAEAVIAEVGGEPAGYALFFHNFSTFTGKPGMYLEDLFVFPRLRGRGLGKALLSFVAKRAVERGCERLDWSCLDWNAPSIAFYRRMGAKPLDDWTEYRAEGEALTELAAKL